MEISATELKNNLGKYLDYATYDVVYITQYGKLVAKLSPAGANDTLIDELYGSVPSTMTSEEALDGRLTR